MEREDALHTAEDEITLKELILKIQEYFWIVIKHKKWVFIITLLSVSFFLFRYITTPAIYKAELTFMVNEDDGGGLGGMAAVLGAIGLGGSSGGKSNLNKILELSKSRYIIQKALFDTISIGKNQDVIANHMLRLYDYDEKWADDTTGLANFRFKDTKIENFGRIQNKVFLILYRQVVGGKNREPLLYNSYGEETGIMKMYVETTNEQLSISLCELIYGYLSEFYVNKTIEKQQQTYELMRAKVDSIKSIMASKEYQIANFRDSNLGLMTTKSKLEELRLQRDIQVLNEMYAVSLKNFEIAEFSLRNKFPFMQEIDKPISPLFPIKEKLFRSLILGVVLGLFLSTLFIVGFRIYKEIMA